VLRVYGHFYLAQQANGFDFQDFIYLEFNKTVNRGSSALISSCSYANSIVSIIHRTFNVLDIKLKVAKLLR
jgi:hypothetical protein